MKHCVSNFNKSLDISGNRACNAKFVRKVVGKNAESWNLTGIPMKYTENITLPSPHLQLEMAWTNPNTLINDRPTNKIVFIRDYHMFKTGYYGTLPGEGVKYATMKPTE